MTAAYIIHLECSKERLPLIEDLKKATGLPIQIFSGSDGRATWTDRSVEKRHPWNFTALTQGMIGCVESHVAILKMASASTDAFFLFEDDAVMTAPFQDFIDGAPEDWDILLLGANEYVDARPYEDGYMPINRSWGTHAMFIHPRCCPAIIDVYENSIRQGIYLPPDWLYNEAVRLKKVRIYGPTDVRGFFQQKAGFVSLLTGIVRQ